MRVGLLFDGDEDECIWGSAVTTFCLAEAFQALGHEPIRASISQMEDWAPFVAGGVDLLISEGVPEWQIPPEVWRRSSRRVFWWLSELYYNADALVRSGFDAVAANSALAVEVLQSAGCCAHRVDLAASPGIAGAVPSPFFDDFCVYLGSFNPNKTAAQFDLLLRPASTRRLGIWGYGWTDSPFRAWHRGVLPLGQIGTLYRSTPVCLALTNERQKKWGMINNRIFEALAAGAIVISDAHAALAEHEMSIGVHFADTS